MVIWIMMAPTSEIIPLVRLQSGTGFVLGVHTCTTVTTNTMRMWITEGTCLQPCCLSIDGIQDEEGLKESMPPRHTILIGKTTLDRKGQFCMHYDMDMDMDTGVNK